MTDVVTLDPDELDVASFKPYVQAVSFGFNEPPISNDRLVELQLDWLRTDKHRVRGVWDERAGLSDSPVATFASWDGTVNAGAGLVPANFITNVTVRPTHKRRGLLRAMMTLDLTEAKQRGIALATLTATDAEIYGRFGFGRATRRIKVEIDSGAKFGLRISTTGRCEFADPADVLGIRNELFARHHAARRGSHSRPSYYDVLDFDWSKHADDRTLRAVVHIDDDGTTDGVAFFRVKRADKTVEVEDMQYSNPEAEVALWELLCGIELTKKVVSWTFDPRSALHWALRDPRMVKVMPVSDHFWLRVLDVPAALEARGFEAHGVVTLEVTDPLGLADGRFRVEVTGGRATVTATTDEPDLTLNVSELGSLYFGMGDVRAMAALRIVTGPGTDKVHDLFRVGDEPWCSTAF